MNISLESELTLYPVTIRQDKKHYIVEDSVSGDFFEMPAVCIDAILLIEAGESLEKIANMLKRKYPDEEVEVVSFAQQLLELGLIKEVDGNSVQVNKKKESPEGFTWIPSRLSRIIFNKVTIIAYLALICINILLVVMNPQLLPAYRDFFLFDAMMLNVLVFMGVSFIAILIHEFGHILAVRSYDLPAKLEVGNRLFFVVFETDLTPAWKLKPNQRNILYLGGICFDQVLLFIAFSVLLLFPELHALAAGVLGMVVLDLFIKTIYQCCFYMKTDLYYLFENITGCYNVMENGKAYLSKWLPFLKKDVTTETFDGETKVVRMYGLFYLCGVVLTLSLFSIYFLPQAVYAFSETLPELFHPVGNPYFWDAVVFLGQTILVIGLLCYSWWKNRRNKSVSL